MRALPLLLLAACSDSSLFVFGKDKGPSGAPHAPDLGADDGDDADDADDLGDLTESVDEVDQDAAQAASDLASIQEDWSLEDGWRISPALTPDGGGTTVGLMIDASEELPEATLSFQARGIAEDGTPGEWRDTTITWSEGRYRVAMAKLGDLYASAELRISDEQVASLDGLSWSLHVPVDEADGEPSSARAVAPDSGSRDLGSTWSALGVVSRDSWGARAATCSTSDASKYRMAIHHTASLQTSGGSVAERVRQIQAYAMDTRGYCDIPYHFLIGIDGSIYEGRPIDTLGAHTAGNNTGNAGMAAVGCFHDSECPDGGAEPSDAMLYAMSRLVATISQVYTISIDSDHVKGHRDHSGASTACPGSYLYAHLDDIRAQAAGTGTVTSGTSSGFRGVWVGMAATPSGDGYWMVDDYGDVLALGDAGDHGDASALSLAAPVVGIAATPSGSGYWLVAEDGGVFTYGDANFYGSAGSADLSAPVVGMAATPSGHGYWLTGSDGAIYAYGDAEDDGDMAGTTLNGPVVGIAGTPSGEGYWLVADDGGIFSFGDASFYGSMGGTTLSEPMIGMGALPSGKGYWTVAEDGGIFSFGSISFYGSMGSTTLAAPVRGMAVTPTGKGYWMVAEDGGIFSFGDAGYHGNGI